MQERKYWDIKPAPKTEWELHKLWIERLRGEAIIAYGRKIKVRYE
jgi:hypothetical protein